MIQILSTVEYYSKVLFPHVQKIELKYLYLFYFFYNYIFELKIYYTNNNKLLINFIKFYILMAYFIIFMNKIIK